MISYSLNLQLQTRIGKLKKSTEANIKKLSKKDHPTDLNEDGNGKKYNSVAKIDLDYRLKGCSIYIRVGCHFFVLPIAEVILVW